MQETLRKIPNMKQIISEIDRLYTIENETLLKECIDMKLEELRAKIISKEINNIDKEQLFMEIYQCYKEQTKLNHQKCINATGIVLHTNLGRAVLADAQLNNIDVIKGYNNLEFDLEKQKRGSRYDLVEDVICDVTNAQAALVVNNNAAAVLLILNEFAYQKDVVVSNSELVEIGGSFRIPEIIKLAQANIKSVGTTNKTHLKDYINAIDEKTGLVAKIHQSNFYQDGFVSNVTCKELIDYRFESKKEFVLYEDLASGAVFDLSKYGLEYEPTITDSINNGVDIVSFSGDKLLGGIQAGIIVGKKEYLERLKKNQLLRTIRPSGLVLNIVESTFRLYQDEKLAFKEIETLKNLILSQEEIFEKTNKLAQLLDVDYEIIRNQAMVGGGCMPKSKLDSYAIAFKDIPLDRVKANLVKLDTPIISVIKDDSLLIDGRLINEDDIEYVAMSLNKVIKEIMNEDSQC